MSLRKKLLIAAFVFLLSLVVLLLPTGIPRLLAGRSEAPAEPPEYALAGPHLVGMRTLTVKTGAPLPLTVWYPGLSGDRQPGNARYRYQIKMGEPLGRLSISSYTGRALVDAPNDLSGSPYPTVFLSPGFAMGTSAYAWLAEHIASYGFVVIAVEHQEGFDEELSGLWRGTITRPRDILDVLAYLDDQIDQAESFTDLIDLDQIAVVGHSYGGYTALASAGAQIDTASFRALCDAAYGSNDPNVFLCNEVLPHLEDMAPLANLDAVPERLWPALGDSRIDALVPLAGDALFFGQPGLSMIEVPVMAIGGTLDSDSPYMWGTHPTYEYTSSSVKARVALVDAEHMIFTGSCERSSLLLSLLTGEFCSDSTWDRRSAHDLTKHFTTAFLLATLIDDPHAAEALQADRVEFPNIEFVSQGFQPAEHSRIEE